MLVPEMLHVKQSHEGARSIMWYQLITTRSHGASTRTKETTMPSKEGKGNQSGVDPTSAAFSGRKSGGSKKMKGKKGY